MTDENPYAVNDPLEEHPRDAYDGTTTEVSHRTIDLLNQTRPWVRLIGVLFWIGTVFLGIACVFMVLASLLKPDPTLVILTVIYTVMIFVYVAIAKSLTNYARKIQDLNKSTKVRDLEDALEAQKNFWRLAGIVTLIGIIVYVLALVLIVSGVFMFGNLGRH